MNKRSLIYPTAQSWHETAHKRVTFIGMSGLGKTYLSNILRDTGGWYHYSVDYRIGTRYMGEHIVDDFKAHAMKIPLLAELLKSDSIGITSKISFNNLTPLSVYLGKPGDPAKGGIPFDDYMRRQALHRDAEIAATIDVGEFIARAQDIYGYPHFVCDTSGSVCEVVDPSDENDPVLNALSQNSLIVWIKGAPDHTETLCERFARAPKPMYSRTAPMQARWDRYLAENNLAPEAVNPDDFIRWSFRGIIEERLPLYASIADNWGVTVDAADVAKIKTAEDAVDLIGKALPG